jgi:cell division protein FtsW (lipid II flippase)
MNISAKARIILPVDEPFLYCMAMAANNQLGMVMGSGCMMALLASALVNMGAAFGIIPFFSSFFPFISAGGSNLLVSYAFLGIIMSIYKYKTAYPQHMDIDSIVCS